jgi:DNA invertase Pin-like site-specific DNA recombinase
MTAYAYVRVSKGEQKRNGHSLEAQAEACLALIEQSGLTRGTETNCDEPGVFTDASSAYKIPLSHRAGGKLLLSNLKSGDTVVMYAIDRGWRCLWECAQHIERWVGLGIKIKFVAYPLDLSTANGRLTAHVMAAYAQWKSEICGERSREFFAAKKNGLISEAPSPRSRQLVSTPELTAVSQILRPALDPIEDEIEGNIYGYIRVSTDDQTVESQIGPVQRYMDSLQSEGTSGEMIRDEGVSALKVNFADRPGAAALLAKLQPGDRIVFLRPARAFRSLRDMVNTVDMIHALGVTIHLAEGGMKSGDVSFQMSMQIMVLMAQIESEENSRRVRDTSKWMWQNGFVPTASCNLPPWLQFVNINEKYRHIVPVDQYIDDCKFAVDLLAAGQKQAVVCKLLEERIAEREHRLPMPASGMDPKLALDRFYKRCPKTPFHRTLQQPWIDRALVAREQKKLVNPMYRRQNVAMMPGHLLDYERYLQLLEDGGVKEVAKVLQPDISGG